MQFYKKNNDGEYVEATEDDIVPAQSERVERLRKTESEKIRAELEKTYRDELTPKITKELETKLTEDLSKKFEGEYKSKLEDVNSKLQSAETQLRQKSIAAEYGFKPDLESFLGDGSEEEMRAKADVLKTTVVTPGKALEKETKAPATGFVSEV
jgi:hypothetical protein